MADAPLPPAVLCSQPGRQNEATPAPAGTGEERTPQPDWSVSIHIVFCPTLPPVRPTRRRLALRCMLLMIPRLDRGSLPRPQFPLSLCLAGDDSRSPLTWFVSLCEVGVVGRSYESMVLSKRERVAGEDLGVVGATGGEKAN